jgi:phage gp46-like protein
MWRDDAYLLDILIAARHARKVWGDLTWEQFRTSALHQHAIAKTLENVGEAAKKVSDEMKAAILKSRGRRSCQCGTGSCMSIFAWISSSYGKW